MYRLLSDDVKNFNRGRETEVYLPNGLGGYLSLTASNALFKKQNAYLTHSFNPPVNRYVLIPKVIESVEIGGKYFNLDSQEFKSSKEAGNEYLEEFLYDLVPTYIYNVLGVRIIKTVAPNYGGNACGITYMIENTTSLPVRLIITPLFSYKPLGEAQEEVEYKAIDSNRGQYVIDFNSVKCYFKFSDGYKIKRNNTRYEDIRYQFDYETGDKRDDFAYTPIDIIVDVDGRSNRIVEACASTYLNRLHANSIISSYKKRCKKLMRDANLNDKLAEYLALSADSFICNRESTGRKTILAGLPWFTDWGRDTMISFTGALLVTRRFKEARDVLLSFKEYIKDGLIPNMFPSGGEEPIYNTADASLWYFMACYNYYRYTNDPGFIIDNLYDSLYEIYSAYRNGTKFNIHMDTDGLIIAGSDLDQVTWMDVRVGDVVVTPRHGKPVEINALWYNALCIMEAFCRLKGTDGTEFSSLAKRVHESFNKYWNDKEMCLYDVIDENDPSVRPNQLFAVSLPFKALDLEKSKMVVEKCKAELFTKLGIRSLSINDPRFKPKYEGSLWNRDMAYHMGTVWPWLMGAYIDAYLYVFDFSKEAILDVKNIYASINLHMHEYCLNGIAEVFDGENPRISRGCSNQAWSVSELLRAYFENLICKNIKIRIDK